MTAPLVVVSAGTYHLPFTRLIEWIEPWIARHPEVRTVVQHGPTRPAAGAENHVILPYPDLLDLCARADAVVLQGGAGGVMDLRALGRKPLVVPRVPGDGEVVDDHQLRFTRRVAELELIHPVLTAQTLEELLDAALAGDLDTRLSADVESPGVERFARVLAGTVPPLPASERWRRLWRSGRELARSTASR
ncbi:UDP-N-acetylglucosamine transferase subunit ALG13 [Diaminobutyricimonas aerilata]|uniref:UDP-N-acetylglucosamine transferase subunit ALG13 n=1 Tax=Diaminobutyricimonas aerilata TaxID=1162967 RepID=A0A2M9CKL0_9MICO|nr:glycosyltransferase [Diaminobutyricimonas aerilata]PJJ72443.1 UDP-N-acetylglucosamine transferase subunit ALG13 [Diaminobutyricimonas aerilata]